jgi:hypothetical protein
MNRGRLLLHEVMAEHRFRYIEDDMPVPPNQIAILPGKRKTGVKKV